MDGAQKSAWIAFVEIQTERSRRESSDRVQSSGKIIVDIL